MLIMDHAEYHSTCQTHVSHDLPRVKHVRGRGAGFHSSPPARSRGMDSYFIFSVKASSPPTLSFKPLDTGFEESCSTQDLMLQSSWPNAFPASGQVLSGVSLPFSSSFGFNQYCNSQSIIPSSRGFLSKDRCQSSGFSCRSMNAFGIFNN